MKYDEIIRAELEIDRLVYACARATDQMDAIAFSSCYCADGVFDRSGNVFSGRAEIERGLKERKPGLQRRHVFTNLHIDIEKNGRAFGCGYCLVFDKQAGESQEALPIVVDFHDEYIKVDGHWKIKRRVTRRSFS